MNVKKHKGINHCKMRKVKCKVCYKLYPSVAEDDYTDRCSDCEDNNLYRDIINNKIKKML